MRSFNVNQEPNGRPYHVYGTVFFVGVALAVGIGWLVR